MIPFTIKYAPKSTADIVGQQNAVAALRSFMTQFPKRRALFLYGPPGAGKTSAAYAVARENNFEIVEINASDARNEQKIKESVGRASRQQSLFAKSKVLLVDEVDGLYGRKDRGAVPVLVKIIKSTAFPIILTANNPWDKKYSALRRACEMVELKPLSNQLILSILRDICTKENIAYEEKALATLVRRCGGDMRGVLIDLQTLATNDHFTFDHLDQISPRRQTDSIFNALLKVFKTTDAFVARTAFNDVQENLEEIQFWIDENLPKEYTKPDDLYRAYEKMSRADVFRGRIMRRQHWHFLAVINILLSAGIALSKDAKYSRFVKYTQSRRLLKIWQANQKNAKRKAIAEKIASKTHCSTRRVLHDTLPYMKQIFKSKIAATPLINFFDFNSDEVAWLNS